MIKWFEDHFGEFGGPAMFAFMLLVVSIIVFPVLMVLIEHWWTFVWRFRP